MIVCVPALSVLTDNTAVALLSNDAVPSRVVPSWKLTVPVAPAVGPTTAVSTAGSPYITVVGLTLSVVVSPAAGATVSVPLTKVKM